MKTAAEKIAKIPEAIITGLAPLMPDIPPFIARLLPPALKKFAVDKIFETSKRQEVIDSLKSIEGFVTPVALNLQLLVNAHAKFTKALKGVPTLSKRYIEDTKKKVGKFGTNIGKLIDALYVGLSGDPETGAPLDPVTNARILSQNAYESTEALESISGYLAPLATALDATLDVFNSFKRASGGKLRRGAKAFPKLEANIISSVKSMNQILVAAGTVETSMANMPTFSANMGEYYADQAKSAIDLVGKFVGSVFEPKSDIRKSVILLQNRNTVKKLTNVKKSVIATADILQHLGKTLDRAKKITPALTQRFENIGTAVRNAITDVAAAGTIMEEESFEKVKPVVDGLAKFGGGSVTINHNLPNAKINLNVNINSRRFAKQLVKTPLKVKSGGKEYITTGPTKTEF